VSRILILEDEISIALDLREEFSARGHSVVGLTGTVEEGLRLARCEALDAAVLDVDLHGRTSYPVADELKRRNIPFVFVTAYDMPDVSPYDNVLVLRKPVDYRALFDALPEFAALAAHRVHHQKTDGRGGGS
jgi:DNA-binding response OmpR family regulator